MTPETFAPDFLAELAEAARVAYGILAALGFIAAFWMLVVFHGDMHR